MSVNVLQLHWYSNAITIATNYISNLIHNQSSNNVSSTARDYIHVYLASRKDGEENNVVQERENIDRSCLLLTNVVPSPFPL